MNWYKRANTIYPYSNGKDIVVVNGRKMMRQDYFQELLALGQTPDWAILQALRLRAPEQPTPQPQEKTV